MNSTVRSNVLLAAVAALACAMGFAQSSGEAIYKQKCQNCHGPAGMANSGIGKVMKVKPVNDCLLYTSPMPPEPPIVLAWAQAGQELVQPPAKRPAQSPLEQLEWKEPPVPPLATHLSRQEEKPSSPELRDEKPTVMSTWRTSCARLPGMSRERSQEYRFTSS